MQKTLSPGVLEFLEQCSSVYFTIDKAMCVTGPSATLAKYLPDPEACREHGWQADFSELFDVVRPSGSASYTMFLDHLEALTLLTTRTENFALRGQFARLDQNEGQLIFVGSPWLAWMQSNHPDRRMMLSDFKAWDAQLDHLILLSTERQNIADLERLAEDLTKARDKAEQATKAQAEFFAIMSHEMRTPLSGVIGALELIDTRSLESEVAKMFEIAQSSARNLKFVVDNVLDYSKLQAGGFENQREAFNLRTTIQSAIQIVDTSARFRGNELAILVSNHLPAHLIADAPKIRQVLINLLSNAIKFTKDGQITVTADMSEPGELQIGVADTGTGISPEVQASIFEPFIASDHKGNVTESSTGLGLNISRRMVEIMNGTMGFDTTPGEGTRFYFTIPFSPATAPEVQAIPFGDKANSRKSGRALLVEDNLTNQFLGRRLLENRGLTVDVASNGQQCVDMVTTGLYDIVFMDFSMPVMDGLTATRILRQQTSLADLPIIALTAHVGSDYQIRFLNAGMNGVLTKPIDGNLLDLELEKWLGCSAEKSNAIHSIQARAIEPHPDIAATDKPPVLDEQLANQLLDDIGIEAFQDFTSLFLAELEEGIDILTAAQRNRQTDRASLAKCAHTLSSTAGSAGCLQLAEQLKSIELFAASSKAGEALNGLITPLPAVVEASVNALKAFNRHLLKN